MENKKTFDFFTSLIDRAFNKAFSGDPEEADTKDPSYADIDEYTQKTGKRFRMTKEEKELGLTREEALQQRFND